VAGSSAILIVGLSAPARADTTVQARLVEQNDSGVRGTVTLAATDRGDLTVSIEATGLMPGPHAQHIHGSHHGDFRCASTADDADGDGWLTNEEASGEYGNVFLALTTRGDTSPESGLALDRMPVADQEGRLSYDRTIPAAQVPHGLVEAISRVHVVQHGIDANDNSEYDVEALGESTFARSLGVDGVPEEATNPAACGRVDTAGPGHVPSGGVATGSEPGGDDGGRLWWAALGTGLLGLAAGAQARWSRARRRPRTTGPGDF
jgi:hypothetical protein